MRFCQMDTLLAILRRQITVSMGCIRSCSVEPVNTCESAEFLFSILRRISAMLVSPRQKVTVTRRAGFENMSSLRLQHDDECRRCQRRSLPIPGKPPCLRSPALEFVRDVISSDEGAKPREGGCRN